MHNDPLKTAGHRLRSSLTQVARIRDSEVHAKKSLRDTKAAIDASRRLLERADKLIFEWKNPEQS